MVTISADGKITDVNEATVKVTGVAREEIIGTEFSNYFTEPQKAREGYQQVFARGFVTDYPLTIRHRDGHLTDVLYNAIVYKDPRGNVAATVKDYQTSASKVFACGDMRRGQSLVVWAIREGRQCARAVDEFLMGATTLPR